MTEWYYNRSTGEVEEGPQSIATERYGPFDSRDEAARAPEIVAARAKAWAEEDAENER
ncbi:methionine aminopeptidase [Marisediminicola sp. LYQ134]|uniref:methionine aminopeptidase n=1 Tax=unclassified Marisediminicola TaxID=2618316 RepID=UPI003983266A